MNAAAASRATVAWQIVVAALAAAIGLSVFVSGFLLMMVFGMGSPGPSFGAFAGQVAPLAAPLLLAGVGLSVAVRGHVLPALLTLCLAAAALAGFWCWVLR